MIIHLMERLTKFTRTAQMMLFVSIELSNVAQIGGMSQ
jgi:hypothetical protein